MVLDLNPEPSGAKAKLSLPQTESVLARRVDSKGRDLEWKKFWSTRGSSQEHILAPD